jgi:hypothetical protein
MPTVARHRGPKLRPVRVLRDALTVYRQHWLVLWVAALIVFTPLALGDAVLEEKHFGGWFQTVFETFTEVVLHLIGDVAYAGIVAAAVIAWRTAGPRQGPMKVLRGLPWRTIVTLDLLIPIVSVLLAVLAIIPGIVFYTYAVLAAPVAKVDHTNVRDAIGGSFRLVRGSFWRVLLVLFVVVVLAGAAEQLLQTATPHFIGDVLVNVVVQMVFAPIFGLASVLMVFDLRRDSKPTSMGPSISRSR